MPWLERLTRKALKGLEPYRPGKPISEVQRELGLREVVRLCSNENPWPLPDSVNEAIRKASQEVNRYPDPGAYVLKRALARRWGVSPSEIMVGAGTEGILYSLFQGILDEGDEVVFPVPTYQLYRLAATAAGAGCVEVPLGRDLNMNVDMILAACTERTKAVVLCNPNNPTGTIVPRADLLKLAAQLEGRQILLIIDEAYADYVADPLYLNGVDLFRQLGTVAILRTFSKIYGMAGLRVGYAIASKPVVEAFSKVRRVFDVTHIGQAAAVAALGEDSYISEVRENTLAEKARLNQALADMGVRSYPTQTNFLLIELPRAEEVYNELLKNGVIVRPGSDLGLEGHVRVTIGLPEENERFLTTLRKVLTRLGLR